MKRKNLIIVLIIVLLLATLGISVAVFSSLTNGNTNNTLAVGDLKFHYTEITGVGNGINLVDPLPITDNEGKVLNGEREYFEFSIESNTIKSDIEYEVVVEPTSKSTVSLEGIKFYLTEVVNNNEQEIEYSINENNKVKTLSEYNETEIENASGRTVYSETIANNTRNYYKKFRARIWLSEDIDWTDEGYIGKTGSFKINVYAKGKVTPKQLTLKETVLYESNGGYSLIELPDSSFTRVSNEQENGLFKSTKTNTGRTTYYFRGNVNNNWVSFAGKLWRIVRVNEDGTVRLIMQDGINSNGDYYFNSGNGGLENMYYSNGTTAGTAQYELNSWYKDNITDEGYNYYVAKGNYYCEAAKTKYDTNITFGSANVDVYSNYIASYNCPTDDGNGKGLINSNVGLLSYDEMIYAGAYFSSANQSFYLKYTNSYFTMSPAGLSATNTAGIYFYYNVNGRIGNTIPTSTFDLRPVINIKANVKVEDGQGTQQDPYIIGTTRVYESIDRVIASLSNDTGDVIMCDGLKGKLSNCSKYNDLSTAIASRNKGTMIIVNDVTYSSTMIVPATKEIVLELNGKTITSSNHVITNRGKLKLTNSVNTTGNIISSSTGTHAAILQDGGSLIINNGVHLEGPNAIGRHANGSTMVMNGGELVGKSLGAIYTAVDGTYDITINGGTLDCTMCSTIVNRSPNATITINGGTITNSQYKAISNGASGTVNINGGTFISNGNSVIQNDAAGTININQTTDPIYFRSDATSTSYYVIANMSSGTVKIKANPANACTDDAAATTSGLCVYSDRDTNNNTRNTFGVVNAANGKISINGGTYYTNNNTFNHNVATTSSTVMTIKNAVAKSSQGKVVSNGGVGTMTITGGSFLSTNSNTIQNGGAGTINIKAGTFTSNNSSVVYNYSTGTINIIQTETPIYMTSLAEAWAPVIRNSTGNINIRANKANMCTSTANDTTSGLCVYAEGDRDWPNVTANAAVANYGGEINIDGGTYFGGTQSINLASTGTGINNIKNAQILSKKYAIVNNNNNGVVNICNSTVQGETGYDLSNQSGSTGTINYTSDVIFSSGTNTPNQNNPNGTITQVNKCPF